MLSREERQLLDDIHRRLRLVERNVNRLLAVLDAAAGPEDAHAGPEALVPVHGPVAAP